MTVRINGSTGYTNGDNVKLKLGASDDLQIYHDGSNSFISDQGTGNLRILAGNFKVIDSTNSENMIEADVNGKVKLYYDSIKKLETTSTGVSISGTLSINGSTSGTTKAITTNSTATEVWHYVGSNGAMFRAYDDSANFMHISSSGLVGIGTTSPLRDLHVSNGGAEGYEFGPGESSNKNQTLHYNRSTSQYIENSNRASQHTWDIVSTEAMRIDSSGNVGIGASSPSTTLHLASAGTALRLEDTDTNAYAEISTSDQGALVLEADKGNTAASSAMIFKVDSSEAMRITSNNRLGINTTAPTMEKGITSNFYNKITQNTYLNTYSDGDTTDILGYTVLAGQVFWAFSAYFPTVSSPSRKVRFYTNGSSNSLWLSGEIILGSDYNNQNASGYRKYEFTYNANSGSQYNKTITLVRSAGSFVSGSRFELTDINWDSSRSEHYFEFRHLAQYANVLKVQMRWFGNSSIYSDPTWDDAYLEHGTY